MADRAGLVRVFPALFIPVDIFRSSLHALLQAVAVVGDAVGSDEAGTHTVVHAELQRIETAFIADIIRERVRQERRLRNAVGTHGAGNRGRSVHRVTVRAASVLIMENILEVRRSSCRDGVSVGSVRAFVGINVAFPGKQFSVLCRQRPQDAFGRMARPGQRDAFFPGQLQADRASAALDR